MNKNTKKFNNKPKRIVNAKKDKKGKVNVILDESLIPDSFGILTEIKESNN